VPVTDIGNVKLCFVSSRRRHTRSVSAFLLNRSSDLNSTPCIRKDRISSISRWITASSSWKRFCLFVCRALSSIMVICMLTAIRLRSEERRVGKECRLGWETDQEKKKQMCKGRQFHSI